ncbi:unnamed protein product [Adineta ricciae]|nr:unnamed protein product [Adineta ricciae]
MESISCQTKDDLTISTIHLVDLAGSERVNRAKTVGERVKEAGNISSSLMVLRRCFETLRETQVEQSGTETAGSAVFRRFHGSSIPDEWIR